jgi:hypothetical protein
MTLFSQKTVLFYSTEGNMAFGMFATFVLTLLFSFFFFFGLPGMYEVELMGQFSLSSSF